jgi:hypothetical protein
MNSEIAGIYWIFVLFLLIGILSLFLVLEIAASSSKTIRRYVPAHSLRDVLVVVVAVFVVLGLLTPGSRVGNSARYVMAKTDVTNIVTTLKAYYTEYGVMPSGGNAQITDALRGRNQKHIVYLELPQNSLDEHHQFIDPWRTPYRIGISKDGFPWTYLFGKNKRDDGGAAGSDGIVSWR